MEILTGALTLADDLVAVLIATGDSPEMARVCADARPHKSHGSSHDDHNTYTYYNGSETRARATRSSRRRSPLVASGTTGHPVLGWHMGLRTSIATLAQRE